MEKTITKLVFLVHEWSQTGQLDDFLPKSVKDQSIAVVGI
jgi:hypothetical protein